MNHQYRAIDVWRRLDGGRIARYRCFEVLPAKGYCVQSVDFFDRSTPQARILQLEQQFIELLVEDAPDERAGVHESLEEAIAAHDAEFSE